MISHSHVNKLNVTNAIHIYARFYKLIVTPGAYGCVFLHRNAKCFHGTERESGRIVNGLLFTIEMKNMLLFYLGSIAYA